MVSEVVRSELRLVIGRVNQLSQRVTKIEDVQKSTLKAVMNMHERGKATLELLEEFNGRAFQLFPSSHASICAGGPFL